MPGWTLVGTHPTQGSIFQRPLDASEQALPWASIFNGHTDILRYLGLHLTNGIHDADLFSDTNIVRAWLSTKMHHLLAGATVQWQGQGLGVGVDLKAEGVIVDDSTEELTKPRFIVRERDPIILRSREIVFGEGTDAAEAQ